MVRPTVSRVARVLALATGMAALIVAAGPPMSGAASNRHVVTACQTGTTYNRLQMQPDPIATFGSLQANQSAQFSALATNANMCVAGATVRLYVEPNFPRVPGDSVAVSPSQCGGTSQVLTGVYTTCTTDANGRVPITYTTPSTLPASGAVEVTAVNLANGASAHDWYLYESLYRFSASPIAPPGSLAAGQSVNLTLSATGVNGVRQPNLIVYLSFTFSGGGSAMVGGTPLTGTPQAFVTDANGNIAIAYTTPGTLPAGGVDTVVAGSSSASTATVSNSTSYAYDAATPVISVGDMSQTEADSRPNIAAVFNVTLSRPSASPVTVFYQTDCGVGDKVCSEDYLQSVQPRLRSITIQPNQVRGAITLTVYSYVANEPYNETMVMQLIRPSGAILGRSLGDGIILGDDETTTAQQLYVGDQGVVASPAGTEYAEVTVTLANPAVSPVSFSYTTTNGTAVGGVDYIPTSGTVSFPSNTNAVYIAVPILASSTTGAAPRSFAVTISNASGASINRATGTVNVIYLNP